MNAAETCSRLYTSKNPLQQTQWTSIIRSKTCWMKPFGARHLTWIPELNGGDTYKNSLSWMVIINKIMDSCQEFLKQNQKVDERARTPWVLWSILGSAPRYVKTPAEAQRDSVGGHRSHAWFWSHGRQWSVSGNWNWDVDDVDTFHWNHL